MTTKDPITCHVLDTTTGRPAAGIKVQLNPAFSDMESWAATTDKDGRIANWKWNTKSDAHILETDLSDYLVKSHLQSKI